MKKSLLAVVLLTIAAGSAAAQTANLPFSATVTDTCTITLGTPGTMMANTTHDVLSSNEGSGTPSTATIQTTGAVFSVSADAPASFVTGDSTNVAFAALYSTTGATTVTDVPGVTTSPLEAGETQVEVDLTATKSGGTFASGDYSAEVVLRCE